MEVSGFTENKDVDREILLQVPDRNFIKYCNINTYFRNICKENNYLIFKRRLQKYFPDTVHLKYEKDSWKEFYAKVITIISHLEENFVGFKYISGNPNLQLQILIELKPYYATANFFPTLLGRAVRDGEISLVKYALPYAQPNLPLLRISAEKGYLDILKLLLSEFKKRKTVVVKGREYKYDLIVDELKKLSKKYPQNIQNYLVNL